MSDNSEIWAHDTLEVNDEGHVEGSAYTHEIDGGVTVNVAITSYEYDKNPPNGEIMTNYVPNVVMIDESGRIIAELHANDSHNPEVAIRNAKRTAEYGFENSGQFTGD